MKTKDSKGFFDRNREFKQFFRPKTGDLQKKGFHLKNVTESGVSPQELQKYRWQTPIWASICTPVAQSLLISSGHSPRLGGHNFRLGGAQAVIWGARPRYALPWRQVWVQPYFEISLSSFIHKIFEENFHQYLTAYLVQIWT